MKLKQNTILKYKQVIEIDKNANGFSQNIQSLADTAYLHKFIKSCELIFYCFLRK